MNENHWPSRSTPVTTSNSFETLLQPSPTRVKVTPGPNVVEWYSPAGIGQTSSGPVAGSSEQGSPSSSDGTGVAVAPAATVGAGLTESSYTVRVTFEM